MSLQDADWWFLFVTRLQDESLDSLAQELDVSVDDLLSELLKSGSDNPQATIWWSEVQRMHRAGSSLEAIATRFKTSTEKMAEALGVPLPAAEPASPMPVKTRRRRRAKATGALPKPRTLESDPPTRRRGRKRIVRPEAIAEELGADAAAPVKPKRRRKKKPDSLHGAVIEVDPSKLDLSELLPPSPTDQPHLEPLPESRKVSVPFPTWDTDAPDVVAKPVLEQVAEPVLAQVTVPAPAGFVEPVPASVAEVVSEHADEEVVPRAVQGIVLGWRLRVDGIEQELVVVAPDIVTAATRFRDLLGASAMARADLYPTPIL